MTISEDTMNFFQITWHYLGLWSLPSQPRHPWYTVNSVLANFTTLIVFNVGLFLSIFVANSFDEIIETLMLASGTVTVFIKVFLFINSRRDFSQLLYIMKLLETVSITSPHERLILQNAKRKSALATSILSYSPFITLALLILNTFIQPERSLLLPSLYPFDWQSNIVWYGLAMFFQVACSLHIIMIAMSVDMWRVASCIMLAGFFDVLCGRLQRLGWSNAVNIEKSQLVMLESKQNPLHEKELIDCVKYHLLCLRYFRLLENTCKLHYFVQFSISSVSIGITAFLLTTFNPMEDVSKFISISGCLISYSVQLAIPCFLGSFLAHKTDQFSFNLYESNWPDMSPKFKSTMSIVLEACREPIYMCTAWNLFIISLPTFVSVVRSAYSMMSFLNGMK